MQFYTTGLFFSQLHESGLVHEQTLVLGGKAWKMASLKVQHLGKEDRVNSIYV